MSHNPTKWKFNKPKDFREQVLNLPREVRPKLTEIMTLLSETDNPLRLGKKKITERGTFYTLWLNETYRLSYDILDFKNRMIEIYRVGDHFYVYGKK